MKVEISIFYKRYSSNPPVGYNVEEAGTAVLEKMLGKLLISVKLKTSQISKEEESFHFLLEPKELKAALSALE